MGRKGGWFSAFIGLFVKKPSDEHYKKNRIRGNWKETGVPRHGQAKSWIPPFRKPSSIEKILTEADQMVFMPPTSLEKKDLQPNTFRKSAFSTQGLSSVKTTRSFRRINCNDNHESSSGIHSICATRIQAAFRGYMVRKYFRTLRGFIRLQKVVRGHNVESQTISAMKQMQLLVRIRLQIHSRRIQTTNNHQLHGTPLHKDKDSESSAASRWKMNRLARHWDDSSLSKEEAELRLSKKTEAAVKRQRTVAYSLFQKGNQPWIRAQEKPKLSRYGYPKWWNWLESHVPSAPTSTVAKNASSTPRLPDCDKLPSLGDDESLTSCPAFLAPSYMTTTASFRARVRENGERKSFANVKWQKEEVKKKKNPLWKSIGDISVESLVSAPAARRSFSTFM